MNATIHAPRRSNLRTPQAAGYTNDYRVMVFSQTGPRLRYLDDRIYTRDEAIGVWLTHNGAKQRNKVVIVQVGNTLPGSDVGLAADGDTAIEQRTEYRPLLVIYPTRQEIDAVLEKRKRARDEQRA
jgi:hypothetical protein